MDNNIDGIFKIFIEQANVGIGWADIEGNVIYLSPKLIDMLKLDNPEDMINKPVFQFYEQETISKFENTILTTVMDKGFWMGELPLKPKKGDVFETLNNIFVLKDKLCKPFAFGNIVIPLK